MEDFTLEEQDFLHQKQIYITKREVTEKLKVLLLEASKLITNIPTSATDLLPENTLTKGKISRGENYQGYPYLILDNPRLFDKQNIFVFRTMILFGHYASCHLQIHGDLLNKYKAAIGSNLKIILNNDFYVSASSSPWIYHLNENDFIKLETSTSSYDQILKNSYFKISKFFPISEITDLPDLSSLAFKKCLQLLS